MILRLRLVPLASALVIAACGRSDREAQSVSKDVPAADTADAHAGHALGSPGDSATATTAVDPHAGHSMPTAGASDAHAGHVVAPGARGGSDHAAHAPAGRTAPEHARHGGTTSANPQHTQHAAADSAHHHLALQPLLDALLRDPAVIDIVVADTTLLRELLSSAHQPPLQDASGAVLSGMKITALVRALVADPSVREIVDSDPRLRALWADERVRRLITR